MKKIYFLIVLYFFTFNIGFSQKLDLNSLAIPYDSIRHKFYYSLIEQAPEVSASNLYENIKNFLVAKFNTTNVSVDLPNKEIRMLGNIVAQNEAKLGSKSIYSYVQIIFDIGVWFKDERYKVEIINLRGTNNTLGNTAELPLELYYEQQYSMINAFPAMTGKKQGIKGLIESVEIVTNNIDKQIKLLVNEMKSATINNINASDDDW